MEEYLLKQEEKMLYRTQVAFQDSIDPQPINQYNTELRLTTERIILITRSKKEIVKTEFYDLNTLKIYNDEAQVIKQGNIVTMYFTNNETCIQFPTQKEVKIFTATLMRYLSGKSKLVRNLLKAKKEIKDTGDSLNIDISGIAKTATEIGINSAVNMSSVQKAGKISKLIGNVAQQLLTKRSETTETKLLPDEQIEQLAKYKQLLDDGAITQEEFDRVKQLIMGIQ